MNISDDVEPLSREMQIKLLLLDVLEKLRGTSVPGKINVLIINFLRIFLIQLLEEASRLIGALSCLPRVNHKLEQSLPSNFSLTVSLMSYLVIPFYVQLR